MKHIILCLFLSSFGYSLFGGKNNQVKQIAIRSNLNSNQSFATNIDIVFVMDLKLVSPISSTTPTDWFINREQFLMSYGQDLKVLKLEIVTGYLYDEIELPRKHKKAHAVLIFSNIISEDNTQSIDITDIEYPLIIINEKEMLVEQQ